MEVESETLDKRKGRFVGRRGETKCELLPAAYLVAARGQAASERLTVVLARGPDRMRRIDRTEDDAVRRCSKRGKPSGLDTHRRSLAHFVPAGVKIPRDVGISGRQRTITAFENGLWAVASRRTGRD